MQPTATDAIVVRRSNPAQVFREQNQTGAYPGVIRNARCSSEPSVMSELWAFIATPDSPNNAIIPAVTPAKVDIRGITRVAR